MFFIVHSLGLSTPTSYISIEKTLFSHLPSLTHMDPSGYLDFERQVLFHSRPSQLPVSPPVPLHRPRPASPVVSPVAPRYIHSGLKVVKREPPRFTAKQSVRVGGEDLIGIVSIGWGIPSFKAVFHIRTGQYGPSIRTIGG